MDYHEFQVEPFEREPGKWRASVQCSGKMVRCEETILPAFTTSADSLSAEEAIQLARGAIDAGYVTIVGPVD